MLSTISFNLSHVSCIAPNMFLYINGVIQCQCCLAEIAPFMTNTKFLISQFRLREKINIKNIKRTKKWRDKSVATTR